jgi:hypothetical protein
MPATYEPIASISPSAAAQVEFTSIPGTHTDLVIVYALTHSAGNLDMLMQFNGDTATNYSLTVLTGNGSAAASARFSTRSSIIIDYNAYPGTSAQAINTIQIMSYANTNVYKTSLNAAARAGTGVDRVVGLWRSTSAITSVLLTAGAGTITGTAALYGIKAA